MEFTKGNRQHLIIIAVVACACGTDGPTELPPVNHPPDPPVIQRSITVVSGDSQSGKAGAPLARPFVVRVTDAAGRAVPSAAVTWVVMGGEGRYPGRFMPAWDTVAVMLTGPDGVAQIDFWLNRLGTTTVAASLTAVPEVQATFTMDATVMVISNLGWPWAGFSVPYPESVPVGTPVEWLNYAIDSVQIAPVTIPPGGEVFGRTMLEQERADFVPNVAGTWEWQATYYFTNDGVTTTYPGEIIRLAAHSPP